VSIFVNDIFNQNIDFRRQADAQGISSIANSAVGRYFGVKFTWNIRKFGKNGSQDIKMYDMPTESQNYHRGGYHSRGGHGGGRF
jgi:hypothetical protein